MGSSPTAISTPSERVGTVVRQLWAFPKSFDAAPASLPSGAVDEPRYYFPGGSSATGHDGMIVRVSPVGGRSWLGVFAFGSPTGDALDLVASTPHLHRLLVVSKGLAVAVRTDMPRDWFEVPISPVCEVLPAPEQKVLVLTGYTQLAGLGEQGIRWVSERVSIDGIRILGIRGNHLAGEASDPTGGTVVPFSVDLATGRHQGGSGGRYQ